MYRKRNGSLGFSFTRFANAAVPNLFADERTTTTISLHPLRRDMLYSHQLASTDFTALDERSFVVAGLVDNDRTSKNVYKALQKAGVLNEVGHLDTYKIGPRFPHQMALLTHHRQRECINLLFWWEEEVHRYRKLIGENEELTTMIAEAERYAAEDVHDGDRKERADHLKFARERVRMKVRQRPTQRQAETENDTDDIMESFRGRALSAPDVLGQHNAQGQVRPDREELPTYAALRVR